MFFQRRRQGQNHWPARGGRASFKQPPSATIRYVPSHRISGSDCSLGDLHAGRFRRLAELPLDSPAAGHIGIGFDSNSESIRRYVPHYAALDQALRAKHHSSRNGVCAFSINKTNLRNRK